MCNACPGIVLRGDEEAQGNPAARPRNCWQVACPAVAETKHGPGVVGVVERSAPTVACGRVGERQRVSGDGATTSGLGFVSGHKIRCVMTGAEAVASAALG
mmetsp:Transcript_74673/g.139413  ORF Transcript_74673/g.139413 Transcript_74673/m.139413 type:complete len:101 (+) Transcript_74673:1024-1326(+)